MCVGMAGVVPFVIQHGLLFVVAGIFLFRRLFSVQEVHCVFKTPAALLCLIHSYQHNTPTVPTATIFSILDLNMYFYDTCSCTL